MASSLHTFPPLCVPVAAAVADLEASAAEQEARDASLAPPGLPSGGHVPALMGPAVLMGAPIRPPGYHPPAGARFVCFFCLFLFLYSEVY